MLSIEFRLITFFMESSSPSGKVSDPQAHRWASILGTIIAVLTLTLPLSIIAYFSSSPRLEPLSPGKHSAVSYELSAMV